MPKSLMIAGPHAIGKSSTAMKLAGLHPAFFYVPSFAGRVAKDNGYDLNSNPTPQETMAYQWKVLRTFQMAFEMTLNMDTVYDRAPLDFAAYAFLQCHKHEEVHDDLRKFIRECIQTTMGYCTHLIIPLADLSEPYEGKGNRPDFSEEQVQYRRDYQTAINYYAEQLKGFCEVIYVPLTMQFDDRVTYVAKELGLE